MEQSDPDTLSSNLWHQSWIWHYE